jgi:hypothetical protein
MRRVTGEDIRRAFVMAVKPKRGGAAQYSDTENNPICGPVHDYQIHTEVDLNELAFNLNDILRGRA